MTAPASESTTESDLFGYVWNHVTSSNVNDPGRVQDYTFVMAKEDTVYLGDVQVKRVATQEEPSSSQEKVNGTASAVTGVKRQLSLADMFSGSRGKGTSGESSSKKLKLSASSNSLASSKSSDGFKISGVQPKLNSIPFSVSSFQETLTEEQMKLLRLECESMGKSWYVSGFMGTSCTS